RTRVGALPEERPVGQELDAHINGVALRGRKVEVPTITALIVPEPEQVRCPVHRGQLLVERVIERGDNLDAHGVTVGDAVGPPSVDMSICFRKDFLAASLSASEGFCWPLDTELLPLGCVGAGALTVTVSTNRTSRSPKVICAPVPVSASRSTLSVSMT